MDVRKRIGLRLHRTMVYWGLLHHPFGRDYVRKHYSPTGKETIPIEETPVDTIPVTSTDPDA
ncbi:hypothetical protein [Natronosalvus caseinilyticus]|uniref:hypothetical protein n=1 Tax=Natronosalvus caseinilyticus TaxID=2953747 RepID=UPI0028B1B953|nr:hypothetical protein [Natronosalvus caseinilyticus]